MLNKYLLLNFSTFHLREKTLPSTRAPCETEERVIKVYYMKERTWLLYIYLQNRQIYNGVEALVSIVGRCPEKSWEA